MAIARRRLGRTGEEVTIMGLGGEGVLRTFGREKEAYNLINSAIDLGLNYFESARAYSGSEQYYGGALKERRKDIFLTSKSHARDRKGARAHLEETLHNMKTGHLDLWQVHDVRTRDDVEAIFAPGGALEAFAEAREQGLARFIGVTGHHDPTVLVRCMEVFDFDTVLIPVNPAEPAHRSFMAEVMPVALRKGMGVIGMKAYFRGAAARLPFYSGMEPFFRYALSHEVSNVVIGCDDLAQLRQNVTFANYFTPMGRAEMREIEDLISPYARALMYYKGV